MSGTGPTVRRLSPPLRILVTNDDGVFSPGLLALKKELEPLGEVMVVAPDRNRTGAARSITMTSSLRAEEVKLEDGSWAFSTDGTPVDCVRMAALGLLESPPELVVSGINLGGNLGDDITYSGTVAAAFEGIMLGMPALAVSAEEYAEGYDLSTPARVAANILKTLIAGGFPAHTLLNINCPARRWEELAGVRPTTLGKRIYGDKVEFREEEGRRRHYFIYGDDLSYHKEPGTDFEAVAEGYVSVTPLHFNLTAQDTRRRLEDWGLTLQGPQRPVVPWGAGASPAAVIFDLDGTLLDSVEHIVGSLRHAVSSVLSRDMTREELIANVGRPLREQMRAFSEEKAEELVQAFRTFNHREHDRMVRLFPGVTDLLRSLQEEGVPMAVVTSKSRVTTEMAFKLTGVEDYFSAVVCMEDTERNKPHPEPLEHCLDAMGMGASGVVYVGDSPYDLQAARSAGLGSLAVTWGIFPREVLEAERPDMVLETVEDLARALGIE